MNSKIRTSEKHQMKKIYLWASENIDSDQDGFLMIHLLESMD